VEAKLRFLTGYSNINIFIGSKGLKAPFLKEIKYSPFVQVPSGKITTGGLLAC